MAKMRIKISKWEWLKMSHQKQMHFERQENDICNPLPSKKKKKSKLSTYKSIFGILK